MRAAAKRRTAARKTAGVRGEARPENNAGPGLQGHETPIVGALGQAVVVVNQRGIILSLNGAAAERLGRVPGGVGDAGALGGGDQPASGGLTEAGLMRIREVVRWREPRGVQGEWSGLADHTWYFPMCDQRGRVSQVVILDCDGTNGRRPAVRVQRDRGPSKSTDAAGSSDVLIRSHRSLTAAETQVLRLIIVEGMSNREAAEHLCRAERTIEAHRYSIMRKLHAHNVVDLVKQAIQQGLVRVRSG